MQVHVEAGGLEADRDRSTDRWGFTRVPGRSSWDVFYEFVTPAVPVRITYDRLIVSLADGQTWT